MDLEACHRFLKVRLSPRRMQHSIGVMQVMEELAPIYGLPPAAARLAGLVHDAAKEMPRRAQHALARKMGLELQDAFDRDPLFLHGPCSAWVAGQELGITDALILEAIQRHSYMHSGAARSPVFCWCLRFADMLEPNRDWTSAHALVRPLALSGQMVPAINIMMDWMIPFLERVAGGANPTQRQLQRTYQGILASGVFPPPNELPV